jgi:hypothetical protein
MPKPTANLTDLPPFASLTRETICRAENIGLKALERLHRKGQAPPRYRVGRRWSYPLIEYLSWKQRRLAEYAPPPPAPPKHLASKQHKARKLKAVDVAELERLEAMAAE